MLVTMEEAKKRWRTHTSKLVVDSFLYSFSSGEVWGTDEEGNPVLVSPDGSEIVIFLNHPDLGIMATFPERHNAISQEKWKNRG